MSPCSSLCMIWVPVWVPVWVPLYRYTCLCVLCPVCSVRWDLPCYVSAQCCIGDLGLAITSNDYKEKVNKTNFQVNFLANLSNQSYNSLCFSIFSWNIEFIVNTCHFYTLGSRLGCVISTVYDMICTYIVSLFLHLAVIGTYGYHVTLHFRWEQGGTWPLKFWTVRLTLRSSLLSRQLTCFPRLTLFGKCYMFVKSTVSFI